MSNDADSVVKIIRLAIAGVFSEKALLLSRPLRDVRYTSHLEVTRLYLESIPYEGRLVETCRFWPMKLDATHFSAPGDRDCTRDCDRDYDRDLAQAVGKAEPFMLLIFWGLLKRRFFANVIKLIKAWERGSLSFATS